MIKRIYVLGDKTRGTDTLELGDQEDFFKKK